MAHRLLTRIFAVALVALLSLIPAATAFAASPQQNVNTDLVGLWVSEESTEGEIVSLSLFDDGSMQGLSEFSGGEDNILYAGEWVDNGDKTISILIHEVDGLAVGSEPFEIVFDVVSDGELNAAQTTDFGDDGMTITWKESEPIAFVDEAEEAADDIASSDMVTDTETLTGTEALTGTEIVTNAVVSGLYVGNNLEVDGVAAGAFVYLFDDGSYQSVVATFDGESEAITQLGAWVDHGNGAVTLTSTHEVTFGEDGPEYADLDEPGDLKFDVMGDVLVGEFFKLYRVAAVAEEMDGLAGIVAEATDENATDENAAADGTDDTETSVRFYMSSLKDILAGNAHALELWADGTATFTFGSGEDNIAIEMGTWDEESDGIITVELTQDANGDDLDEPATIVFEPDEDGNLIATDFDADRYGESIVLELDNGQ